MAAFTHGELESLDPILEQVSTAYRLLGRGVQDIILGTWPVAGRPSPHVYWMP